jgi:hypothetical protein
MQTKSVARVATVVFALSMLTVYVVGSQRRHNQGAFVLHAAEGGSPAAATAISRRGMVAYGSKSGPVFVPETPPVKTNAPPATNSAKAKKSPKVTNVSQAAGTNFVVIMQPRGMVASSSKSAAVFVPEDMKAVTSTNKIAVNPEKK